MAKKYILTGYRDRGVKLYKPAVSKQRKLTGVGLMGMSFLIPDLGIGLVIGSMMFMPISISTQLKNMKSDISFYINKKLVLWGLK